MWPFSRSAKSLEPGPVFLTNTLGGGKHPFVPLRPGQATLYSCGPTVYSRAHIGNLRSYVFADTLARVLAQNGYRVRRVINITDVGHLTGDNDGDADAGEDRMEKSAREAGTRAEDIADRYTRIFMDDIRALNVATDEVQFPRATHYIPEQIALIKELEKSGHTYRISDGIYFDTRTFPAYGKLGGTIDRFTSGTTETLNSRVARIKENQEKRNPADFALWKFSPPGTLRQQEWSSPWGRGFPGWHIECSAMSKALLGPELDIHTGGIDHIPVHHNNEIAQSESVTHRSLARTWMHGAFLTVNDERIGKSVGNALYLSDLQAKGFHPLALRYLYLQANYRTPLSFSWESLAASQEALMRLWKLCRSVKDDAKGQAAYGQLSERIRAAGADDLATPKVLAALWEGLQDETVTHKEAWGAVLTADAILGLDLANPPHLRSAASPDALPEDVQSLVNEREAARASRDFARSDELRIHIESRGYHVEDSVHGAIVTRKPRW